MRTEEGLSFGECHPQRLKTALTPWRHTRCQKGHEILLCWLGFDRGCVCACSWEGEERGEWACQSLPRALLRAFPTPRSASALPFESFGAKSLRLLGAFACACVWGWWQTDPREREGAWGSRSFNVQRRKLLQKVAIKMKSQSDRRGESFHPALGRNFSASSRNGWGSQMTLVTVGGVAQPM
jgi:phage gp46-like protein